ncbi:hypothetical protein WBP07_12540 [Novosphingobium sp. BL-8A]|uniref:hypothetical protein n=1 Tax=Novosphingobium sp. BL-8A TaxID=3127639 RepID=UPI0037569D9A
MNAHHGIQLDSRYSLEAEIKDMERAIGAMSQLLRSRIESIWCDSKACAVYDITFRPGPWDDTFIDGIRNAFGTLGGHNGIHIQGGPSPVFIAPEWDEDDFPDSHTKNR